MAEKRMVEITRLFSGETKDGGFMLSGKLGGVLGMLFPREMKILVFPNNNRTANNQPDYILYAVEDTPVETPSPVPAPPTAGTQRVVPSNRREPIRPANTGAASFPDDPFADE